jgi:hypothetical protein
VLPATQLRVSELMPEDGLLGVMALMLETFTLNVPRLEKSFPLAILVFKVLSPLAGWTLIQLEQATVKSSSTTEQNSFQTT